MVDFNKEAIIANTGANNTQLGALVLDANMLPVRVPMDFNPAPGAVAFSLVPLRKWNSPKEYDYSRVLVGLLNAQNKVFTVLPLELSVR